MHAETTGSLCSRLQLEVAASNWVLFPLVLVAALGLAEQVVQVFLTNGLDDGLHMDGIPLDSQVRGLGRLHA